MYQIYNWDQPERVETGETRVSESVTSVYALRLQRWHNHHLYCQMLMDVDNLDQTNVDESLLPDPTPLRNRGKSSSLNVTVDDAHPFDLDSYISAYKGIQGGVSCG